MQTCANAVTVAFAGLETRRVEVQAQLAGGTHGIVIVGLGDKAVSESRERVRAAFASIGLAIPAGRLVVNLAPADLPKEGTHFGAGAGRIACRDGRTRHGRGVYLSRSVRLGGGVGWR